MKSASIVTAKNTLTELIYQAEEGQPVQLTRRGKGVAVLISEGEYERLKSAAATGSDFAAWAQTWRTKLPPGFEGISTEELQAWSDG